VFNDDELDIIALRYPSELKDEFAEDDRRIAEAEVKRFLADFCVLGAKVQVSTLIRRYKLQGGSVTANMFGRIMKRLGHERDDSLKYYLNLELRCRNGTQ